jgi:hypothetical protein
MKWRIFFAMNGEEQAAEYLKDQLTELGPAFVKIGQAVSSRPDVVPPVYIRQLEYLQARAPLRMHAQPAMHVHNRSRSQPASSAEGAWSVGAASSVSGGRAKPRCMHAAAADAPACAVPYLHA